MRYQISVLSVLLALLAAVSANAEDLKPTAELGVINAKVTDYDGKPYRGESIRFVGEKNGKVIEATTDHNGRFSSYIPKGETYEIQYQSLSGPYKCGEIKVPLKATYANLDIQYENTVYELKDVLFETGKASLQPGSENALNTLVTGLKKQDTLRIEIAGHTDNVGGDQYNLELSQARANTVRQYLVDHGIAAERVEAHGYGFSQPVADNDSESGRALNRRTEVRILNLKRE